MGLNSGRHSIQSLGTRLDDGRLYGKQRQGAGQRVPNMAAAEDIDVRQAGVLRL